MPCFRGPTHISFALSLAITTSGVVGRAADDEAQLAADVALEQAEAKFLETDFAGAEIVVRDALQACQERCSDETRTRLFIMLASVVGTGEQRLEDAKEAFVEALRLDPAAKPDPDMASEELRFAYARAREQLGLDAEQEPAPSTPPISEPEPEEELRRNWFRVSFVPDFGLLSSATDVCTPANQEDNNWVCTRQDESRYLGVPENGTRNATGAGVAISTLRLLIAYDRLLADNWTVGLRAGYAFRGADEADAVFIPVHVEARVGLWFGDRPFADIVRPHIFLAGGLGQVDTKRNVRVVEDRVACGATTNNSDDCSIVTDSAQNRPERPRFQDLTAFKQAGPGFVGLGFGVGFSPTSLMTLDVGVRASVTFPVVMPVFSPEAGVSFGF